ncbi:MAG: tetratricopeptide repeat protein [Acidobacteriota bacterium]
MTPEAERAADAWLELGTNPGEWLRLEQALDLADGFQFLPLQLVNADAEELLTAKLSHWCHQRGLHLAGFRLDQPPSEEPLVRLILRELQEAERPCIFFFPCGRSLYRGAQTPEGKAALRDFFLFLNQKRDVLAERADASLLLSLHRDDWQEFRRSAPDFWSIRQANWRFIGPSKRLDESPLALELPALAPPAMPAEMALDAPPPRWASVARPELFVGRERELKRTRSLLTTGEKHLAIIGPEGIGKTSFVLEACHQAADAYPDGLLRLDLADSLEPPTKLDILRRLVQHLVPGSSPPTELRELEKRFRSATKAKSMLLIVEGVEDASLLQAMSTEGGCRVLATARERLPLPDRFSQLVLSGLTVREGSELVELELADMAYRATHGPEADFAPLVRLFSGHPLSLRLAAALLHHGEDTERVTELARREVVDQVPRLARAVLAGLTPEQRYVWRRQAVFRGDFGATEAAAFSRLDEQLVRQILTVLVRNRLLSFKPKVQRYTFHHKIRHLAGEELATRGELEATRDEHARVFLAQLAGAALEVESSLGSTEHARTSTDPKVRNQLSSTAWTEIEAAQAWVLERCEAPDPAGQQARQLVWETGVPGYVLLAGVQTPIQRIRWAEIFRQAANQQGQDELAQQILAGWDSSQLDAEAMIEHFRWLRRLARGRGDRPAEAEALLYLGRAQHGTGSSNEAVDSLRAAWETLRHLDPSILQSHVLLQLSEVLLQLGAHRESLQVAERAVELADQLENDRGRIRALSLVGEVLTVIGDLPAAQSTLEHALEISEQAEDLNAMLQLLVQLGKYRKKVGELEAARELFERALDIARTLEHRRGEALIHLRLGEVLEQLGDWRSANRYLQKSLELSQMLGDVQGVVAAFASMGWAFWRSDQPNEAIETWNRALRSAKGAGDAAGMSMLLRGLGAGYLSQGRYSEAVVAFEEGIELSRELSDRHQEARFLSNAASSYLATDRTGEARRRWQQALEIAEEIGDAELVSEVADHLAALN